MDFSICIAHAGDPLGLWATIHSCEESLKNYNYSYEYRICVNGLKYDKSWKQKGHPLSLDLERMLKFLSKSGKLGYLKVVYEPLSPPTARHLAAQSAQSNYLFFFDNHCLVGEDYFEVAMETFKRTKTGLLHSATKFFEGENLSYHYVLTLEKDFWAGSSSSCPNNLPYKIAAGGHGGFAVSKYVWDAVGGYWDGFTGYGGEEMYFDLAAARMGFSNYLDPLLLHYHYPGTRPYARHYTDDYYRNMMMCANIIGGEEWLYKVYDSFENRYPMNKTPTFELLMQAYERSEPQRKIIDAKSLHTLDECLDRFANYGVAH